MGLPAYRGTVSDLAETAVARLVNSEGEHGAGRDARGSRR
jgi:hypothetical protein